MKNALNKEASTSYADLFEKDLSLKSYHPALKLMESLSERANCSSPTAVDRIEVYKECHRLAEDLYHLTGSKRIHSHVLRIGDLLLSRIFNASHSLPANQ